MDEWEYCQIKAQISDDGRGFTENSGPGNRLMWFRFIAQTDSVIISKSKRIPMPSIANEPLAPQKGNSGHQNVLDDFILSLQHDGWTLLTEGRGEWWERRFRRATSSYKVQKPKLKRNERLTIIVVIAVLITLGVLVFVLVPEAVTLRNFLSTDLTRSISQPDPAVGQMIVIDINRKALDPIHHALLGELTTSTNKEVDTIVWLDCKRESNWKGATADCQITLIDWHQKLIIAEHLIEGEFILHPPKGDPNRNRELDPLVLRDSNAIIEYLTSLSRN